MASSSSLLRLLTRSVVPFRPPGSKPFRLPTIHTTRQHSVNISQTRPFSSPSSENNTPPKYAFDMSFLLSQMETIAGVPSILFTVVNNEELTVKLPGIVKTETDEGVCASFHVPGFEQGVFRANTADNYLLVQFKTPKAIYLAAMKLPENFETKRGLKIEMKDEILKLTLPMEKKYSSILDNIKNMFADNTEKIPRPKPYCEMFDRSNLGRRLCEMIADSGVKSKSFTAYKKDDGESVYFKGNMPGVESIVVSREGLCVSLRMRGFVIEDVELGFEYDALIIEGRRGNEHYIAGVRVPEGFCRENGMIKREMVDGVFKVTLPYVDVKRRVFSAYGN